jgi:hypothetical protein
MSSTYCEKYTRDAQVILSVAVQRAIDAFDMPGALRVKSNCEMDNYLQKKTIND